MAWSRAPSASSRARSESSVPRWPWPAAHALPTRIHRVEVSAAMHASTAESAALRCAARHAGATTAARAIIGRIRRAIRMDHGRAGGRGRAGAFCQNRQARGPAARDPIRVPRRSTRG